MYSKQDNTATTDELSCPRATCLAVAGEPCFDRSGRPRKNWHTERIEYVSTLCAAEALELLRGR